uniref:hypothetical protein n=1 Tax=Saccharothrix espanaensis TaxID=103731 RepID=UPI003F4929E7
MPVLPPRHLERSTATFTSRAARLSTVVPSRGARRAGDRDSVSAAQGRLSPADSVLVLGALGFAVFLIQWQHVPVLQAVLTAAGAAALYTAVVAMPKATRRLVVQVTALAGLVANVQAAADGLASTPGAGRPVPGAAPLSPPPSVVVGTVAPDGSGGS